MSTTLQNLQKDFQSHLLAGDAAITAQVVDQPPASAGERIGIYADGYVLRLLEALGKDFPVLKVLLGDDAFAVMGRAYVAAHPSRHPSLRWLGQHLPQFLYNTAPYAAQSVLAEMAQFEWAQGLVFDGADAETVSAEGMAKIAPDRWADLHFVFQPTLKCLQLHWNVSALWRAADAQQPLPDLQRAAAATDWLLWRRELMIHWRPLEARESAALTVCLEGGSFGDVCAWLAEVDSPEAAPAQAAGFLKQWLTDGIISRIE